jgi:hypothetical protein
MSNPLRLTSRRHPSPAPLATGDGVQPRAARCRSGRTIGFWLGGAVFGIGGCVLGVCMPYHHPVAVVISTLWWGIYLGCFGASVGALVAMPFEGAAVLPASEVGLPIPGERCYCPSSTAGDRPCSRS